MSDGFPYPRPWASTARLWLHLTLGINLFVWAPSCIGDPSTGPVDCDAGPGRLFNQKIKPLLESDRPDTCSQCHTAGIALQTFVRSTPCEAMACLREAGLVDLTNPELSVLLSWIGRAKPESELITPTVINQERTAFLSWFQYEATCESCADVTCPDPSPGSCAEFSKLSGSFDDTTDPGDCSQETLERLFRGTVYENRGRCSPCHFESEDLHGLVAPRFIADLGSCDVASLATMNRLTAGKYLDLAQPERSLLLLKPLPESAGGVPHEGDDKFAGTDDSTYKDFLHFIRRYAGCQP